MPRNLTDLMEAAVSAAPPEPHHASDITQLAERRQRRRTTFVTGGAALAVAVVAVVTVGLTQHHPSSPEPVGRYQYGRTVDASSAVPASSLPGYRPEPWTIPSVQHLGPGRGAAPTYQQVDAQGRLIVQDWPNGPDRVRRTRIFDGPGRGPRAVQQPPSPGSNAGTPTVWLPSFLDDGRLLWHTSAPTTRPGSTGFHVTDLDGGHDVFVHSDFGDGISAGQPWIAGDRMWFTSYDGDTLKGTSHSLYTAPFSGPLTKVASHVAVAQVADGRVVWVTTAGHLVTETAAGGPQQDVRVPLTEGCRMSSTLDLQNAGAQPLAVSDSAIALPETCGPENDSRQELLAFDWSGRLLVHVTGLYSFNPSLGHDALVFQGLVPSGYQKEASFRYDLVTGTLAALSPVATYPLLQYPQAAGRYVLWYDRAGGHAAEFTGS